MDDSQCADEYRENFQDRMFRLLVDNAPDTIMLLDPDLTVLYAAPSAERVLGYRPQELANTDLSALFRPEEAAEIRDVLTGRETEGAEDAPYEFQMCHRDGSWRSFEVWTKNLLDAPDVGGMVAYFHDITRHKVLRDALAHRAFHDPLTGLPNRTLFADRLEHALEMSKRRNGHVTVLFLDLDNFKNINDEYGHGTGDLLLSLVARRLRSCLRSSDTVARFGGDEFVALIEDTEGSDNALRFVKRIRWVLKEPFLVSGSQGLRVAISIGAASSKNGFDQAEGLIYAADAAMYQAKKDVKPHVALWDAGADEESERRIGSRRPNIRFEAIDDDSTPAESGESCLLDNMGGQ